MTENQGARPRRAGLARSRPFRAGLLVLSSLSWLAGGAAAEDLVAATGPQGRGTVQGEAASPAALPPAGTSRRVIADSNVLVYRAGTAAGAKRLSDVDREEAENILRINRTRGTYQTYLLYTSPEMEVPILRPGFIITLPPPSKRALEKQRAAEAARPGPSEQLLAPVAAAPLRGGR